MPLNASQRAAVDAIGGAGLTDDETIQVIGQVASTLPPEKRQQAASALFGVPPTRINGLYWLVLGTLCFVLLLCALRLVGVNWFTSELMGSPDQILGMFTTLLSFLIGLFVPSPVSRQ